MNCFLLLIASAVLCIKLSATAKVVGRTVCGPGAKEPPTTVDVIDRLAAYRDLLRSSDREIVVGTMNIGAFIIGPEDAHMSDYPVDIDRRLAYVLGFNVSAGVAIITQTAAAYWTDERYFKEADETLSCEWSLMRLVVNGTPTYAKWLDSVFRKIDNRKALIDPTLITEETFLSISMSFAAFPRPLELLLANYGTNPQELINLQKSIPSRPINALDLKFAGVSWQEKIKNLRANITARGAGAFIVTALDEIAWLFNLRGSDVEYTPYFLGFAIVELSQIRLYIHNSVTRLKDQPTDAETTKTLHEHLSTDASGSCTLNKDPCVTVKNNYLPFYVAQGLPSTKVWVTPETNYYLVRSVKNNFIMAPSPIAIDKAVRNPQERIGMRNANIRDSVMLIRFLAFLEKEIQSGKEWTELKVAGELEKRRQQLQYYRGPSFETIAGYGSSGAITYRTTKKTNKKISNDNFFLLDSGGQYLDGTTDTTRTMHYGKPTSYQKNYYTRVLMTAINFAKAKFPEGLLGSKLDAIIRRQLWEAGMDDKHGTTYRSLGYRSDEKGPGIVAHLRRPDTEIPLRAYQYYTDKVGYYRKGEFGIRLENVYGIFPYSPKDKKPGRNSLQFDPVTFVPYETKLINYTLLDKGQVEWLNEYNSNITQFILPLLGDDGVAKKWLAARTKRITFAKIEAAVKVEL